VRGRVIACASLLSAIISSIIDTGGNIMSNLGEQKIMVDLNIMSNLGEQKIMVDFKLKRKMQLF
jgi:hypothetical protein